MRAVVVAFLLFGLQSNEAALRARIVELEARVKTLEAQLITSKPATGDWKTLASWKGAGSKNTESFATKNLEWRIAWTKPAGILSVTLYDAKAKIISIPVTATAAGSDVSYVRVPPGSYYLEINSSGSWDVRVEEK